MIQATPFCNLDCDYCYLPARHEKPRMSRETLELIAERVAETDLIGERLTIVWHGGEPLVRPVSFYRESVAIFDRILPQDTELRFAFQTNATLIDETWCEFLADPRTRVGVSIDGPAALNDAHRKTRRGEGSLEAALAGLRRLQAHGIAFTVISVLTREALEYPDELLDFYQAQGIDRVGFNVEELEGAHRMTTLGFDGAEQAFKRFLRRLIRVSHRRGWPVHVRELEQLLALLSLNKRCSQNDQTTPFSILSVDWQGGVSTFSPELLSALDDGRPVYLIGDIHTRGLAEMAEGERFRTLRSEIDAGVALCRRDCGYFDHCGGGAPANKLFENGTMASTETLYCRLMRKAILDVTLEEIACFTNLVNPLGVGADTPAPVT